jgi:hypothetical protein
MPTDRRSFLAGVGALAAASAASAQTASRASGQAVAFDGFPIIDARPVGVKAERLFPGRGEALLNAWRTRQFEYTWLRTLSDTYADFWQTTQDALAFAARSIELPLDADARASKPTLKAPAWAISSASPWPADVSLASDTQQSGRIAAQILRCGLDGREHAHRILLAHRARIHHGKRGLHGAAGQMGPLSASEIFLDHELSDLPDFRQRHAGQIRLAQIDDPVEVAGKTRMPRHFLNPSNDIVTGDGAEPLHDGQLFRREHAKRMVTHRFRSNELEVPATVAKTGACHASDAGG